jgi:eukaryotic-like serine/threonine-protein kinase
VNPATGITLSNRYTLTERIAAGGMGEVWAATDTVLGRTVAIKLLHPGLSQDSSFAERFRAEARHTAGFHHPNITTVFDYGEDGGAAYLVMEYVAGQPLSQIISERAPLSAQETTSILIQAATALEVAHQGGVVHRDVKPANIMITADGTAKLTDFGISRLVDAVPLTLTGNILGTAQYLSPEQAIGQTATAACDIYALGIVGHEMLTGKRPFDYGTMVATALAHINQAPPPLPDTVPARLRHVIAAALAKNPAARPASAAAMADALGKPDAANGSGVPAGLLHPSTTTPDPERTASLAMSASTLALPAVAAMAAAVALPVMATGATLTPTPSPPTAAPPTEALPVGPPGTPERPPGTPQQPPGMPERPSRHIAAWLLSAAALLGLVAFFLVTSNGAGFNSRVPAPASIPSATSNPNNTDPKVATIPNNEATPNGGAAPKSTAPAVPQPPAVIAPLPRRDNRGPGNAGDENDDDRGGRG